MGENLRKQSSRRPCSGGFQAPTQGSLPLIRFAFLVEASFHAAHWYIQYAKMISGQWETENSVTCE